MLIRPRLTDHFGLAASQAALDFAIPFVDEDIPLYVDPFLLWKSPSQQDNALHRDLIAVFGEVVGGSRSKAVELLIESSECDEVGLGNSRTKVGKRIGSSKAGEIVDTFHRIPEVRKRGLRHIEEIQLLVDGVSKDRISDFACSFLKSFLIDYTIDQCDRIGIPTRDAQVRLFSAKEHQFKSETVRLPHNPSNNSPVLLTPKRWLRLNPWINFDEYFRDACPQDDIAHAGEPHGRVEVLKYNRSNYGQVESYIAQKELTASDCFADPLFDPIPITSVKRHISALKKLASGNDNGVDKEYERIMEAILPSMLYPQLDFATIQSRNDSGSSIRDIVFYNPRVSSFLGTMYDLFSSQQIVFELKNVKAVERQHIDQLNRYLTNELGRFGVLVTRNSPSKAIRTRCVDLWSGQRKAIIILTDDDIFQMAEVFETKQRVPLDVLVKRYYQFTQSLPL